MPANMVDRDKPPPPPNLADGAAGGDGYPFGPVTTERLGQIATNEALHFLEQHSLVTSSVGHMALRHHPDLSVKFVPLEFSYLPPYYGETARNN